MAGGETHPDRQTLPPRTLVLARSLLAVRAGRSKFYWGEERRSRAAAEEDPVQTKGATLTERDTVSHCQPALALPWDRETVMATEEMGSEEKGKLKETGAMGLKDRGTETERGGKDQDPRGWGRAHSESHCCISGPGLGPCGRLGYPESHADRQVSQKQTPPPAPG